MKTVWQVRGKGQKEKNIKMFAKKKNKKGNY